jgi:hypothetical protein
VVTSAALAKRMASTTVSDVKWIWAHSSTKLRKKCEFDHAANKHDHDDGEVMGIMGHDKTGVPRLGGMAFHEDDAWVSMKRLTLVSHQENKSVLFMPGCALIICSGNKSNQRSSTGAGACWLSKG